MLTARGICKSYKRKPVLRQVDFVLREGVCLGVAGHNGSGKSTLLAVLAQTLAPDAGDVLWQGKSVLGDRDFMRRNIGYVPQQGGLLADVRVDETLRFWQKAYGLPAGDPFAPSSPAAMMGLGPLAKSRVGKLSGGTQKRLSIAIALLHRPQILLLDEAFAALDRQYRQSLNEYLDGHLKSGGAALYCSHEMDELFGLCGQLLVLRGGERVFWGDTDAFPEDPAKADRLLNAAGPG